MAPRTTWLVPRHAPMVRLAEGLWEVAAELDRMPIGRRMIVARLGDGRLVVHNAVCVDEPTTAALEREGPIGFVIVPNGFHRLDAAAYRARFPGVAVVCPAAVRARVEQRVAVDGTLDALPDEPTWRWQPVAGVPGEAVFLHHGVDGVTAIWNDVFFNLPARLPGWRGRLVGWMGSTGGAKVTPMARRFLVKDRAALAAHLRAVAAIPGLVRVVPGHGDLVHGADAAVAALERAAAGLGA